MKTAHTLSFQVTGTLGVFHRTRDAIYPSEGPRPEPSRDYGTREAEDQTMKRSSLERDPNHSVTRTGLALCGAVRCDDQVRACATFSTRRRQCRLRRGAAL
ncbi:hypothetical protein LIA77_03199 [Sarocladium implicatum]|nr:hypothetical protein LIA77_03199 [Sarocladium implicatum]